MGQDEGKLRLRVGGLRLALGQVEVPSHQGPCHERDQAHPNQDGKDNQVAAAAAGPGDRCEEIEYKRRQVGLLRQRDE